MNMNQQEEEAVRILAKKHGAWLKWGRYLCLIIGVAGVLTFIRHLAVIDWTEAEEMGPMFSAMMVVQIHAFGGICAVLLGKALFQWRGDPRDILLLKLLKDSAERNCVADQPYARPMPGFARGEAHHSLMK